jgi:hypothetical protein
MGQWVLINANWYYVVIVGMSFSATTSLDQSNPARDLNQRAARSGSDASQRNSLFPFSSSLFDLKISLLAGIGIRVKTPINSARYRVYAGPDPGEISRNSLFFRCLTRKSTVETVETGSLQTACTAIRTAANFSPLWASAEKSRYFKGGCKIGRVPRLRLSAPFSSLAGRFL